MFRDRPKIANTDSSNNPKFMNCLCLENVVSYTCIDIIVVSLMQDSHSGWGMGFYLAVSPVNKIENATTSPTNRETCRVKRSKVAKHHDRK